jgi:uroporphyrinogen-III synthase
MRVLVTRPEEDARETAARLIALGHEAIIAPLISIRFIDGPRLDLEGVQVLIATSSNGVRALALRTTRRDIALFAVGRQTAETARREGFVEVASPNGDAVELANHVAKLVVADNGELVHASGREASGALVAQLIEKGFDVRREVLYETPAVQSLPAAAATALRENTLDVALFFSERTARIFCERVNEAGLAQRCARLIAACISTATAEGLSSLKFHEIRIASTPDQDALLACLG